MICVLRHQSDEVKEQKKKEGSYGAYSSGFSRWDVNSLCTFDFHVPCVACGTLTLKTCQSFNVKKCFDSIQIIQRATSVKNIYIL